MCVSFVYYNPFNWATDYSSVYGVIMALVLLALIIIRAVIFSLFFAEIVKPENQKIKNASHPFHCYYY